MTTSELYMFIVVVPMTLIVLKVTREFDRTVGDIFLSF